MTGPSGVAAPGGGGSGSGRRESAWAWPGQRERDDGGGSGSNQGGDERAAGAENWKNLFVKYLPPDFKDHDLCQLSSKFGRVTSCKVMLNPRTGNSLGFGFVSFSTPGEAAEAMRRLDGLQIGRKTLHAKYSRSRNTTEDTLASRPPNQTLYIKQLQPSTTEEQLRTLFAAYGSVQDVKVLRTSSGVSKQVGLLRFDTVTQASAALEGLNGHKLSPGAPGMAVFYAEGEAERQERLKRQRGSSPTTIGTSVVLSTGSGTSSPIGLGASPRGPAAKYDGLTSASLSFPDPSEFSLTDPAQTVPTPPPLSQGMSYSQHGQFSQQQGPPPPPPPPARGAAAGGMGTTSYAGSMFGDGGASPWSTPRSRYASETTPHMLAPWANGLTGGLTGLASRDAPPPMQPPPPPPPAPARLHRHVVVYGLSGDAHDQQLLAQRLMKFGHLLHFSVVNGYGYASFAYPEHAEAVVASLDGQQHGDRYLRFVVAGDESIPPSHAAALMPAHGSASASAFDPYGPPPASHAPHQGYGQYA